MIHHISISAENPERVANVIAEIWQGYAFPFVAFPGSYIAFKNDDKGTGIEVLPLNMELVSGGDGQPSRHQINENASRHTVTHAALSVPASEEQIMEIAAREGWRAETFSRDGVFSVVELWIENRMLLELLPPEFAARYLEVVTPQNYAAFLKGQLPQTVGNN